MSSPLYIKYNNCSTLGLFDLSQATSSSISSPTDSSHWDAKIRALEQVQREGREGYTTISTFSLIILVSMNNW